MIKDQEPGSVMGTVGNGYGREFVSFFLFHLAKRRQAVLLMGFFDGANLHRPSDGARVASTMGSLIGHVLDPC